MDLIIVFIFFAPIIIDFLLGVALDTYMITLIYQVKIKNKSSFIACLLSFC